LRRSRQFPLAGGNITLAVRVAPNDTIPMKPLNTAMPATVGFCRVAVTLTPTSDSTILAELWLPDAEKWNGKFLGVGNGGFGARCPLAICAARSQKAMQRRATIWATN